MPSPDKGSIINVCIDDFALKKRDNYGTVMVDINTHQIIDMINSRETQEVAVWLKTYPNLELISGDGSISYKKAITQANVDDIQVSDRFHLLKGLTDAAKKCVTKRISANFGIPRLASHYARTKTADYWKKDTPADLPSRKHSASYLKKIALVEQARALKKKGCTNIRIAEELGIHRVTVGRYLKPDFSPSNGKYNTTEPSKIKPYAENIKKMLEAGFTFKRIEAEIREKGYHGAASTIRMFATRERKRQKEANGECGHCIEKLERKWLLRLLYKPLEDVKGMTQEQLDKVIEFYPVIGRIYEVVHGFRETLFAKNPMKLEAWIEEAELLKMDEINSFINGIQRDMDAVKKAIETEYSNGLAEGSVEGSVNKIKMIKRIMYGRNSFRLLKNKVLRLELKRKIN